MNKTVSIIIISALVVGIGIVVFGWESSKNNSESTIGVQNSEIKDNIQYITINAKTGYSPKVSTAKSGIPTKLIIKTNGTYDCSSALVIRSLNYQKILPQSGETVIDVGIPKAGVPLQGMCSMGMYSFVVNFS